MKKEAWKLFPTLVNYYKEALAPDQLSTIFRHCLEVEAGEHSAFVGHAKSSFNKSSRLIEDLEAQYQILKGLKSGLANLLKDYGRELGFENVTMGNSWFNVQYPAAFSNTTSIPIPRCRRPCVSMRTRKAASCTLKTQVPS